MTLEQSRSANLTRRELFEACALGLGVPALASLLVRDSVAADERSDGWHLARRFKASDTFVSGVRFSPNGKLLATPSSDELLIWNVEDGDCHARYEFEIGALCVAYSPDGTLIAVGHRDGSATLVDLATGKSRVSLKGHAGILRRDETLPFSYVRAVCFSPEGRTVATGADDGRVKLWDVATGQQIAAFERHGFWIYEVAFSPDGKLIASAADTANVWEVATGTLRHSFRVHDGYVRSVAFSPDGKTLATAGADHAAKLWNVSTGQEQAITIRHSEIVYSAAFFPKGNLLLTGSGDHTAKLSDTHTGLPRAILNDHSDQVFRVTFSPDGKMLATASHDGTVAIYKTTAASDEKRSR